MGGVKEALITGELVREAIDARVCSSVCVDMEREPSEGLSDPARPPPGELARDRIGDRSCGSNRSVCEEADTISGWRASTTESRSSRNPGVAGEYTGEEYSPEAYFDVLRESASVIARRTLGLLP